MGAPQILPLTTAVRHDAGFSAARFGYSSTASPDRYFVRSWNFASSIGPMFGIPWFGGSHIRSGSDSLASRVANRKPHRPSDARRRHKRAGDRRAREPRGRRPSCLSERCQHLTINPVSAVQVRLALSLAAAGSLGELAVRSAVAVSDPDVSMPVVAVSVRVVLAPLANEAMSQFTDRVVPTRTQVVATYAIPAG